MNASSSHTATHCNTPQHTATHCNTLQHTATHISAAIRSEDFGDDEIASSSEEEEEEETEPSLGDALEGKTKTKRGGMECLVLCCSVL